MILVTGATGHVGNTIIRDLLENNKDVRAFVLKGESVEHIKNLPIEIVYGDLLDSESLYKAMIGCNIIIHTAALVSIGNKYTEKQIMNVNVNGFENLLKLALKINIERIIYISSIHAFNELKRNKYIDEATSTIPKLNHSPYARSKAEALKLVRYFREKGMDISVLYPTGITGPYDYLERNNTLEVIRHFIKSKSKKVYYFEGGYDFVDVRDVSKVSLKVLDSNIRNNEYILSAGRISLLDIYEIISKYLNVSPKFIKIPIWLIRIGTNIAQVFAKIFKKKIDITPQAVNILLSKCEIKTNKIKEEMNFRFITIEKSVIDSLRFMI